MVADHGISDPFDSGSRRKRKSSLTRGPEQCEKNLAEKLAAKSVRYAPSEIQNVNGP